MAKPRIIYVSVALAMLMVVTAGPRALSDAGGVRSVSGHLSAVSSGEPWRQSPVMVVQTRDTDFDGVDGPRVAAVREAVGEALKDRGITVAKDGSPVLRYEVSSARGSALSPAPQPPSPPARDPEDGAPAPHPPGEPYRPLDVVNQVTVPLTPDGGSENPTESSISFLLFEHGETPVWRATVTASGAVDEPAALLRAMTGIAMAALGTDAERDFVLNCTPATGEQGGSCQP